MLPHTEFLRPICSLLLPVLYGHIGSLTAQARVKHNLVHILMVVANIKMRALKTEVGKGSTLTSIGREVGNP